MERTILAMLMALSYSALWGDCESCKLRRASHTDDLSAPVYYEDSSFFKSNIRQGEEADQLPSDQQLQQFDIEDMDKTSFIDNSIKTRKRKKSLNNSVEVFTK